MSQVDQIFVRARQARYEQKDYEPCIICGHIPFSACGHTMAEVAVVITVVKRKNREAR